MSWNYCSCSTLEPPTETCFIKFQGSILRVSYSAQQRWPHPNQPRRDCHWIMRLCMGEKNSTEGNWGPNWYPVLSQTDWKPSSIFFFSIGNSCLGKGRMSWDRGQTPKWYHQEEMQPPQHCLWLFFLTVFTPFIFSFFFHLLLLCLLLFLPSSLCLSLCLSRLLYQQKKKKESLWL